MFWAGVGFVVFEGISGAVTQPSAPCEGALLELPMSQSGFHASR